MVTLFLWTMVVASETSQFRRIEYDWRVLSNHNNAVACHKTANTLRIPNTRYRCINPNIGDVE